jgi:hypothetical protein
MAQSKASRMDESLGMRRGAERDFSQSYKDRRDESKGASKIKDKRGSGSSFNIPDNQQSFEVRRVPTDSEQYDLNRIDPYSSGSKGYPAEAWNYKY